MDDVHCYIYMFPDNFQRTTLILYFFQFIELFIRNVIFNYISKFYNYHTYHSI